MAQAELVVDELPVDQGLGTGDGIVLVMAHQQRLGHMAQIHHGAAHLQAGQGWGLERPGGPASPQQAEGQFRIGGIGGGTGVVDEGLDRGAQLRHPLHRGQPGGVGAALAEEIQDLGEVLPAVAESAVLHRHGMEAADAGDAAGGPGHRTVTLGGGEEPGAALGLVQAAGGVGRPAEDVDHLVAVGLERVRRRLPLLIPQPAGLLQNRLGRQRGGAVPDPAVPVPLLEVFPQRLLEVVVPLRAADIDEAGPGQELQGPGEVGDQVEHLLHRAGGVDPGQLARHVGLAQQGLHHLVGALIGGAEHHEAGSLALHDVVPEGRVAVGEGAHHQAAHAVGQETQGPAGGFRLLQQRPQARGQLVGCCAQGQPPVVSEAHHPMAAGQVAAEIAVEKVEELLRRHGLLGGVGIADLAETAEGEIHRVEPDPIPAARQPEVGSHDAGEDHHHRQVPCGRLADAAGALRGAVSGPLRFQGALRLVQQPRQRGEGLDRGGIGFAEPAAQGPAGGGVGEIAEMAHAGAALEEQAGKAGPGDARAHGIAVDDEVVVQPIEEEEVGEEHPQTLEQMAAFDVAGDHGQGDAGLGGGPGQEAPQRSLGKHRLDPGNEAGIGAMADDLEHHPLEAGMERVAGQGRNGADQGEQGGEERVEVAAGQQGAAGGGRHPHVALDAEASLLQHHAQVPQAFPLLLVGLLPCLVVPVGGDEIVLHLGEAEQIAHQAAAGVAEQVETGPFRQDPRQSEGVVDRALGEGAVLEGIDAIAVGGADRLPVGHAHRLQITEGAGSARSRAMDEHQQGPLAGIGGQPPIALAQEFGKLAAGGPWPAVETGRMGQAILDGRHQGLGAQPGNPELRRLAEPIGGHLAQSLPGPFEGLRPGLLQDGVAAEIEAEQALDQIPGGSPPRQAGRRAPALEPRQNGREVARRGDHGHPLLHLQQHHLIGRQRQAGLLGSAQIPGPAGEVVTALHPEQPGRQEGVVGREASRSAAAREQEGEGRVRQGHSRNGQAHGGGLGCGHGEGELRRARGSSVPAAPPSAGAPGDSWPRAGSDGWRGTSRGRWRWRGVCGGS